MVVTVRQRCLDCGTRLAGESWAEGLCPRCLLALALEGSASARGDPVADATLPTLTAPSNLPSPDQLQTAAYPEPLIGEGPSFVPGQLLGERYRIESMLGRGGMGEVWRAYDLKLRLEVALKNLHPQLFDTEEGLELLRDEVRAAREVTSPNVCRLFDLVEVDGQELVSMEYIDGVTLLEHLREEGPLELKEANEIGSQLLAGLEAIHQAGLVHRDIKPENVMLTRTGRVVVMDFGLTSPSGTGSMAGTPAYMAPEQARGEAVDARADVFSVGMVLAEMLSAEAGPEESSRQTFWRAVREEPPQLPDSPWRGILNRAVRADLEERYVSALELARALEEVAFRVEGAEVEHPYPGLSAFRQEDAEFFLGREAEVEAVWKKLGQAHLLGLIGPSGSGKSSFIHAGLIPASPEGWSHVVLTPGRAPFAALGRVLLRELEGDAEAMEALVALEDLDSALKALRGWRARHEEVLLVVDQFEELFTQSTEEVQGRFAELLGRAALDTDVRVLLSLRDDFLMHCRAHYALAPLFADLTALLPPMGSALRRAVVQPALRCGYRFEDESVVEEMLQEVTKERGALPLIAFTAAQLWERRDQVTGYLTREAYEQTGGVGGALAQHAERTLDQIGPSRTPIVRELFRNLVTAQGTRAARDREELLSVFAGTTLGTAGRGAGRFQGEEPMKRPASVPAEIGEAAAKRLDPVPAGADGGREAAVRVLNALIDARLLTSYEVPAVEEHEPPDHRIEIVHESLLTAWPRLVRWQMQDQEGAQLRDELRSQAQLWQQHACSVDYLWTGTAFKEYELWRERYPGGLTAVEEEFAYAMTAHAERRRRRRRWAVSAVLLLAAVITALTSTLWIRSEKAERQARDEALRAEASKLLALAQLRQEEDPTEALAYTTASLELADSEEARVFAMRLLWEGPPALELVESDSREPVFSPDGSRLAAAGHSEAVTVWTAEGGDPPLVLSGHLSSPRGSNHAFWASSELLLTGHWTESRVRAWSVPGGRLVREIDLGGPSWWQVGPDTLLVETEEEVPGREVYRLRSWQLPDGEARELGRVDWPLGASRSAFSPDGKSWLYAKGERVYLRPLPTASGRGDRLLGPHATEVTGLWPLRDDPLQVYSADREGELRIWDFSQGEPKLAKMIPRHEGEPERRVPDPSMRWAVGSARESQQARVWDLDAWPAARPLTLRRSGSWYGALSTFHPSGDWLVVSTHHYTRLTFWPLRGSWPHVVDGYSGHFRPLAFSPDGRWLATSWTDETIRLWPLPGSGTREARTLALPEKNTRTKLAFDPLGRFLFVVGNRDRAYVVPLDGSPPRKLDGFSEDTLLYSAAVSPSGHRVATAFCFGEGPKTLRVWDLETGELRLFDLPKGSPSNTGYERGVEDLAFADESTLYTAGDGGVRRWNLEARAHELVFATQPGYMASMALAPDGRSALVHVGQLGVRLWTQPMEILDLATGVSRALPAFGKLAGHRMALDASATVAASGDQEGIVRAGRVAGGQPHLLVGHEGPVDYVAISPDGRWLASTGGDNTLRLWPMPDLDQPPLHTLPREELVAKLKSLTNIRVVRDQASAEGWKVTLDPFPGWAEVPSW